LGALEISLFAIKHTEHIESPRRFDSIFSVNLFVDRQGTPPYLLRPSEVAGVLREPSQPMHGCSRSVMVFSVLFFCVGDKLFGDGFALQKPSMVHQVETPIIEYFPVAREFTVRFERQPKTQKRDR